MDKIVVIPDVHGQNEWKRIVSQNEDATKYIFLGDYFDSFYINGKDQIDNFKNIVEFAKNNNDRVIMLLGNHDCSYIYQFNQICSGYQYGFASEIADQLEKNKDLLQIAHMDSNILFTHAGVSFTFLKECLYEESMPVDEFLNNLWHISPGAFNFTGTGSPYGDDEYQGCVWIRPKSLMKDNERTFMKQYIQIVGHTVQENLKSIGNFWFTDTMQTSREYLTITDGVFKINNL